MRALEQALRLGGRKTLFWLIVGIIASLVMALVELSITVIIQLFLKVLGVLSLQAQSFPHLSTDHVSAWQLGSILLFVGLFRSLAQFFVMLSSSIANETLNARLKLLSIYEMLQGSRVKYIPASVIAFQMSELFPKASMFCYYTSQALSLSLQCLALAILMLLSAWREACVGLIGLGIVGMLIIGISKRVRREAKAIPGEQQNLIAGIERVARNWLLVQALRTKRREYLGLLKNIVKYTSHSLRANFLSNVAAAAAPFLGMVLLVIIIILSRTQWQTSGLAVVSCLYLFIRFTQNLATIATNVGFMNSYFPQFKSAVSYFSTIPREDAMAALQPSGHIRVQGVGSGARPLEVIQSVPKDNALPPTIEVAGLSFTYPEQVHSALSGLTFRLAAGQQCALVGPSGSGKSTLLALVLGLLEPTSGRISLDGRSPRDFFRPGIRVGYVGPDPFIIEGSVKDNLDYGCEIPAAARGHWLALKEANLESVVRQLPGDLEYRLNANADGLSAGQKQRLALARALLNHPQLLILDEPSANLDDDAEAQIAESILRLKGKTTVILVSHRRGILKFADSTVDLAGAAEGGTPWNLLAK